MKFLERFDEQEIHRQPNGAAPIGIAAEKSGLGFRRPIADFVNFAAAIELIRFGLVNFRERADAVVAQKFRLVERAAQETFHAVTAQQ